MQQAEDIMKKTTLPYEQDLFRRTLKVRFAPSPTGPLHIGGARSALFNWLFARHYGGIYLVRIEDTDLERSSKEWEGNILDSLRWLGLTWDEGIQVDGPNGPYRQTERLGLYQEYAGRLLKMGAAYYCYCSEEELVAEREAFLAEKEMPRYSGKCRNLSETERSKLEASGRSSVLRFKVTSNRIVKFNDLIRGEISFDCAGIGDFIIMKSDGIPTYNFAVVVDDFSMGITHVIRAEEHLANTPRQILIYEALGWPIPEFAHVSLILGKDRSKMSKRHGATSLEQYQKLGYLPEALVNFLALLGWSPGNEEEVFSIEDLKQQFSLERVAKSPAVFDLDKLNWLNGYYIRHSSLERITKLAIPFLQEAGYLNENIDQQKFEWLKKVVASVRDYLSNLSEITRHVSFYFSEQVSPEDEKAQQVLNEEQVPQTLRFIRDKLGEMEEMEEEETRGFLKRITKDLGLSGKKVYLPLRVALTGSTEGPELYQVIPILGRDKAIVRLEKALSWVRG